MLVDPKRNLPLDQGNRFRTFPWKLDACRDLALTFAIRRSKRRIGLDVRSACRLQGSHRFTPRNLDCLVTSSILAFGRHGNKALSTF